MGQRWRFSSMSSTVQWLTKKKRIFVSVCAYWMRCFGRWPLVQRDTCWMRHVWVDKSTWPFMILYIIVAFPRPGVGNLLKRKSQKFQIYIISHFFKEPLTFWFQCYINICALNWRATTWYRKSHMWLAIRRLPTPSLVLHFDECFNPVQNWWCWCDVHGS